VIKVEPPGGEATRNWKPAMLGQSLFFISQNAGKKSLELDLREAEDADALRDLIAQADVLVENLKPGALGKLGFGPDAMAAIHPGLIYCSVSGFGADTVYAGRPAFDTVIQAASGLMDLIRHEEVPVKAGVSYADLLGATAATAGILAALEYRDRTGQGQYFDLSMQDIAAWATRGAWNGASRAPAAQLIQCTDGFVMVEAAPDVAPLNADAAKNGATRAQCAADLTKAGYRAAVVLTLREALEAPQTLARALVRAMPWQGKSVPVVTPPFRMSKTPPALHTPGPPLGRDNFEILGSLKTKAKSAVGGSL
jgi:crotonobetainyl-CoA:carnitine CoA-transferase CaiB-like acyl-CoA transferase